MRAEVEHGHVVDVRQPTHRVSLPFETAGHVHVLGELPVEELHRHYLAHLEVLDPVDRAHPTPSDEIDYSVPFIDDQADQRIGGDRRGAILG